MQYTAGEASFRPGLRGAAAVRALDPVHGGEVGSKKVVALEKRSHCSPGIVTSDPHKGMVPKHG
jgi:hypothetical protein